MLRDEILNREEKKKQAKAREKAVSQASKETKLKQVANEFYREIEEMIKEAGIAEINTRNIFGFTSRTGQKGVSIGVSCDVRYTDNYIDFYVSGNNVTYVICVENETDLCCILQYVKQQCRQNNLLIYNKIYDGGINKGLNWFKSKIVIPNAVGDSKILLQYRDRYHSEGKYLSFDVLLII